MIIVSNSKCPVPGGREIADLVDHGELDLDAVHLHALDAHRLLEHREAFVDVHARPVLHRLTVGREGVRVGREAAHRLAVRLHAVLLSAHLSEGWG